MVDNRQGGLTGDMDYWPWTGNINREQRWLTIDRGMPLALWLTRRHRWLKRVVDTDSRERARMVDRAWCGNYREVGPG